MGLYRMLVGGKNEFAMQCPVGLHEIDPLKKKICSNDGSFFVTAVVRRVTSGLCGVIMDVLYSYGTNEETEQKQI